MVLLYGVLSLVAVPNPALSFSCECEFSWEFPARSSLTAMRQSTTWLEVKCGSDSVAFLIVGCESGTKGGPSRAGLGQIADVTFHIGDLFVLPYVAL